MVRMNTILLILLLVGSAAFAACICYASSVKSKLRDLNDWLCWEAVDYVAGVIQAEAGGESKEGKYMVAVVIHERARILHKTPYEVVREPNQFAKPKSFVEPDCTSYAHALVNNYFSVRSDCIGYTHFYNPAKKVPYWSIELEGLKICGGFLFCRAQRDSPNNAADVENAVDVSVRVHFCAGSIYKRARGI